MSKTVDARIEVGEGHLGKVFIHHFQNQTEERFGVRMGNHTIDSRPTLAEAEVVANALAGVRPKKTAGK